MADDLCSQSQSSICVIYRHWYTLVKTSLLSTKTYYSAKHWGLDWRQCGQNKENCCGRWSLLKGPAVTVTYVYQFSLKKNHCKCVTHSLLEAKFIFFFFISACSMRKLIQTDSGPELILWLFFFFLSSYGYLIGFIPLLIKLLNENWNFEYENESE